MKRFLKTILCFSFGGVGFLMFLSHSPAVTAQGGVGWPVISLTKFVGGVSQPVHITHAGDGSGRIFVVERAGQIRLISNGVLSTTIFLNIQSKVQDSGSEEGLLSVAFPPDYASKKRFYVYYTNTSGNLVIARYGLLNDNQADPNSEQVVLTISHPNFSNHNGGQLVFGPKDGYLYAGIGDGGSGGDPNGNGQNPGAFLGKILRLDVETGNPTSYTIPPTNPFTQTGTHRGEIWALGVRNPWRFSFDRQTGDLYSGDVGQNIYEEINFQAASGGGQNYGWKIMEGAHCFQSNNCNQTGLTLPVAEYSHADGCSVTGGFVYRGSIFPQMQGIYFYGDYCSGKIWGLKFAGGSWQNTELLDSPHNISTFGEDEAGNLYLTSYDTNEIYQVIDLTKRVYLPLVRK